MEKQVDVKKIDLNDVLSTQRQTDLTEDDNPKISSILDTQKDNTEFV